MIEYDNGERVVFTLNNTTGYVKDFRFKQGSNDKEYLIVFDKYGTKQWIHGAYLRSNK